LTGRKPSMTSFLKARTERSEPIKMYQRELYKPLTINIFDEYLSKNKVKKI
jgi:hypothetical protein